MPKGKGIYEDEPVDGAEKKGGRPGPTDESGEGALGDWYGLHTPSVRDKHVLSQRRQVDDAVDARPQDLDPLESRRAVRNVIRHKGTEGQENIGVRDERTDVLVSLDTIDVQLGKSRRKCAIVDVIDVLGTRQQQQQIHREAAQEPFVRLRTTGSPMMRSQISFCWCESEPGATPLESGIAFGSDGGSESRVTPDQNLTSRLKPT